MRRLWRSEIILLLAVGFSAVLLFADNLATQSAEGALHDAAASLATHAGPSIQRLSALNRSLHRIAIHASSLDPVAAQALLKEARGEWMRYLTLPVYDGERALRSEVEAHWDKLEQRAEAGRWTPEALVTMVEPLRDDVSRIIDLNITNANRLSAEIGRRHETARDVALIADLAAVVLVLSIGAIVFRGVRRTRQGLEVQKALISERADELEAFSGRLAHDILSPLSVQLLAWDRMSRAYPDDEDIALWSKRARSALHRTQQLVHGLLGFALAGAKPGLNERTDVERVIHDVLDGAELDATSANVSLVMDVDVSAPLFVACSAGVFTSLCLNLVHNAIKYMGESALRRVTIHARPSGAFIRVEVEDTGPGVAHEQQIHLFEPYVRAHGAVGPGIGLGLATVRRLSEAHGGRSGLFSTRGQGSTFWFEMPAAQLLETRGDALEATYQVTR